MTKRNVIKELLLKLYNEVNSNQSNVAKVYN